MVFIGFSAMTPILFSFAGVLVILDEIDCGMAKYYGVTPVGKNGYLASRISGTLLAIITALFVVAFEKNKIERMALVKLCGFDIAALYGKFKRKLQ